MKRACKNPYTQEGDYKRVTFNSFGSVFKRKMIKLTATDLKTGN